jgi:hypothetical protein
LYTAAQGTGLGHPARPSTSGQNKDVGYIHRMKRRVWCKPARRWVYCLPTRSLRVMAAGGSPWKMRCGRESGRLASETTTCTCNLSLAKHSTIRDRVESSAAKLAVSTRCIEYCYWTVTMEDPPVFANRPRDASGSWEAIGRQRNAGSRSKPAIGSQIGCTFSWGEDNTEQDHQGVSGYDTTSLSDRRRLSRSAFPRPPHTPRAESQGNQRRQDFSLQFVKAPLVIFIHLACYLLQSTADARNC